MSASATLLLPFGPTSTPALLTSPARRPHSAARANMATTSASTPTSASNARARAHPRTGSCRRAPRQFLHWTRDG